MAMASFTVALGLTYHDYFCGSRLVGIEVAKKCVGLSVGLKESLCVYTATQASILLYTHNSSSFTI